MPNFLSISKSSFSRWRRNWFSSTRSLVVVICAVAAVVGEFVVVTETIAVLGAVLTVSEADAVIDVKINSFVAEVTIASGAVTVFVAEGFDVVTIDSSLTKMLVETFSARFVVLSVVTWAEGTVSVVIGTPLVILDPVIRTDGAVNWVVPEILVAPAKMSGGVWDAIAVNGEVAVTERGVIAVVNKVMVVSEAVVLSFRILLVSIGAAVSVFATKILVDGAIAIVAWEVVPIVRATFSVIWGRVTNVEDDLVVFISGDGADVDFAEPFVLVVSVVFILLDRAILSVAGVTTVFTVSVIRTNKVLAALPRTIFAVVGAIIKVDVAVTFFLGDAVVISGVVKEVDVVVWVNTAFIEAVIEAVAEVVFRGIILFLEELLPVAVALAVIIADVLEAIIKVVGAVFWFLELTVVAAFVVVVIVTADKLVAAPVAVDITSLVVIVGKTVVSVIAGSEAVEEIFEDIEYDAVTFGVVGVVFWIVNAVFEPVIKSSWAVFVFDTIIDIVVWVMEEAGAAVFLGLIAEVVVSVPDGFSVTLAVSELVGEIAVVSW